MTSGVSAFSSVLVWNYRKVLEITSISGPAETMDPIELTSHDSSGTFREFVAGLKAGGEITIEGNFIKEDDQGQIDFHTDLQGGTSRACFIVMPMAVGGALSFTAYAKGFTPSFPVDGKISVSGTLVITGAPTLLTAQEPGMSAALTGHEYEVDEVGGELSITPVYAVGTYAYICSVVSTEDGVKVAVTSDADIIYVQGATQTTTEEGAIIALGAEGSTTDIFILLFGGTAEVPDKAPRIYILSVSREAGA